MHLVKRATRLCVFAMLALGMASPSFGQSLSATNQSKLLQLSEILGAVHHLRALCNPQESQTWRKSMIDLIKSQDAPEWLADQMIERFNQGFYREQKAYPVCTEASERRSVSLANQGSRLARNLSRS